MPRLSEQIFGDAIRLDGYRVGHPLWPGAVIPITYYWRALRPLDERYKYIANATEGGEFPIPPTEREFYDGALSSLWWTPGTLIVEESEIHGPPGMWGQNATFSLQYYSMETLEKLSVTGTEAGTIGADGLSLKLPLPLFPSEFGAPPEN